MKTEKSKLLNELLVNAKDRKYQVWERNSLGVPLWKPEVFNPDFAVELSSQT
jgi:hypothetical protein